MKTLSILCALALSSCAVTYTFDKPNSTAEELSRDAGQCDAQAAMAPPSGNWTAVLQQRIYLSCMQGKGWTRVK